MIDRSDPEQRSCNSKMLFQIFCAKNVSGTVLSCTADLVDIFNLNSQLTFVKFKQNSTSLKAYLSLFRVSFSEHFRSCSKPHGPNQRVRLDGEVHINRMQFHMFTTVDVYNCSHSGVYNSECRFGRESSKKKSYHVV